jgi:hypothetical protein
MIYHPTDTEHLWIVSYVNDAYYFCKNEKTAKTTKFNNVEAFIALWSQEKLPGNYKVVELYLHGDFFSKKTYDDSEFQSIPTDFQYYARVLKYIAGDTKTK